MASLRTPEPAFDTVDTARFRAIMRMPVSTVAIVATGARGERAGCTVTSVCSLSDAPPSLLVCLNNQSAARHAVVACGRFTVNYLADCQQGEADRLAGRLGGKGDEKFDSGQWLEGPHGLPCLAGALASIACEVTSVMEFGTHSIVCGTITGAKVNELDGPLLYGQGRYITLQPSQAV